MSLPNYGAILEANPSCSSNNYTEFLNLKESIYINIIIIEKQFQRLEKVQKIIDTKQDTGELNNIIESIQKLTIDTIKKTSCDIKKLNFIVKSSSTEKSHQLMLEKIVSEFQATVQKYLQSEEVLLLKMKRTLLVNVDSDDEAVDSLQYQQGLELANMNSGNEHDVNNIKHIISELFTLVHDQGQDIETLSILYQQVVEDNDGKLSRIASFTLLIFIIVVALIAYSLYSDL